MSPLSAERGSTESTRAAVIVVGVFPGQPDTIIHQAAAFANRFAAALVCVHVEVDRYIVQRNADGTVYSATTDPDLAEDRAPEFPARLRAHLASLLDPTEVRWRTMVSAGDPADALSHIAEAVDAVAIVVGTHRPTARSSISEFFNGSVAIHLAHRQRRPIIVIPTGDGGQATLNDLTSDFRP
ncbi:universal stress protein [Subtercola frigoramans]|uniref:Nucleotide-binding universal stress UspA family protein n=1 Tax=Subtercola frigoramans TaxID=120298 RepID=A0ABS2L3I7_9MICO|nr:universal stress protein [Subtercola frigoramans]MBM7471655.1 nucleotide-binding universal stress UspA family protein [Subtercola frigoramans]